MEQIGEQFLDADTRLCVGCNASIAQKSRFCSACGQLQVQADNGVDTKWSQLKQVALFYLLDLICCCLARINSIGTFTGLLILDCVMAVIAVTFFLLNWTETRPLLSFKEFSFQKLSLYCAFAFIAALGVNNTMTWLNIKFFSEDYSYYLFFLLNGHGAVWMIISMAVVPAIFEELAYRGYVLQKLTRVIDSRQAAFVTSLLFSIIHLNVISLVWLVPFALALAHIRLKENTIWYGVAIHFCFNLTACLLELY